MKILIIRFSSMGDVVLTTPVVRVLKTQIPDCEIHFVTKEAYATLVDENPYIHRVHLLRKEGLMHLIKQLRKERFDLVVDLHHNLRSFWVKSMLMTKSRTFKKLNIRKWLLVNFKINLMPPVHVVDRYLETVKHLDVVNDQQGLDFFINDRDDVPADWLPEPFQKRYVVVAIGGKFATKRLPLSRLIELCDRINKPIVLIGGKEDAATGAAIEAFFQRRTDQPETEEFLKTEFGKKAEVFNGCGKFTVGQSASIIKQAMVVFAHDTGMMHIAAAFRKTIYTIWGNTVPSFGMYPYQTKFVVFENNKINCRPCTKIGKDQCPKGHFKCMNEVVFDFYLP